MTDLVENTPGRLALEVMETVHKDLVFKKPSDVARKRKKMKVLDEESYVEEIGNIIQRDFFPDLEKIKAQNDYLDAMERNDSVRLRELYMKYSGKRPPTERIPSPATFETPTNLHPSQADLPDFIKQKGPENIAEPTQKKKSIGLDQYLNSHTSQDNESFEEILDVQERRQREKYKYLYEEEESSVGKQDKLLALPSIQQQAALPEKPFNLDTWGYTNRNCLMFNPEGVDLTKERELEINKHRHEIVYSNTRLKVNPFNEVQSKETINELAKTQAKVLDGKIGVDGKELLKPETPKIGGFSLVRTPSPSPSVLGTPLMTWGEIEGTPFRLDGSDTPLPKSQGPSFKMAEPPRRERLALALAEKVGEKNRDQKKRALDAQRRQFSTPSPRPNTSTIERLATMSPAARKLATSHLKIPATGLSVPRVSPSPHRTAKTPNLGVKTPTPKRIVTPKRGVTPKLDLGIRIAEKEVSTDDLLNISLPSRKAAADFF
ncbi:splicing factor ESS-2 homolog [Anthonomus grandis grandis]|uniref:splicing factor ESS-2 homolog n=1 Tax=Anthonomus grandis grandis TaxID=2921223 RepID=UPI002166578F|nr:splicing factor ESS-2 homolog [Anthonomus grandis grandis]